MTPSQELYAAIVTGLLQCPNRYLRPEEIQKTADSYFTELSPRFLALG